MKHNIPIMDGALANEATAFIEEKQRIGCEYYSNSYLVREFSRYAENHPEYTKSNSIVTKQMVEEWVRHKTWLSLESIKHRATVIRQFAIFLDRNGYCAYVLPELSMPKPKNNFTPYIFTENQLSKIFQAADKVPFSSVSPFRHLTIPLIFRLIYGCGLRLSEATGLRIGEVDIENGILSIKNTKFGKNRNIPMSNSLCIRCKHYHENVHMNCTDNDFFFPNFRKDSYASSTIYTAFRRLLKECDIKRVEHGPRVHDLRHTYAVHTLKKWAEKGYDLNSALPLLSTYMGHNGISGTQRYLRLTADLYPHIVNIMDTEYGCIFEKENINDAE